MVAQTTSKNWPCFWVLLAFPHLHDSAAIHPACRFTCIWLLASFVRAFWSAALRICCIFLGCSTSPIFRLFPINSLPPVLRLCCALAALSARFLLLAIPPPRSVGPNASLVLVLLASVFFGSLYTHPHCFTMCSHRASTFPTSRFPLYEHCLHRRDLLWTVTSCGRFLVLSHFLQRICVCNKRTSSLNKMWSYGSSLLLGFCLRFGAGAGLHS